MKKTLSVLFAVIFAFSALVGASAIGLVNESTLKSKVASYMGYDESQLQDFSYNKTTQNMLDYYTVTFRYSGVSYTIGVNALGAFDNYSYSANKVIVPAEVKDFCISELEAKGSALKEANCSSSDAIFKSEKFAVKDGAPVYSYDFLSKSAEWNVDVNGVTGGIINSSHADKNVIVMFFIRLFAKIAALFG